MDVITHTLTPEQFTTAFGVCLHSVHLDGAIIHSVLYLRGSNFKARPKPISGRTSYIRVRLEFLRYPQVIRARFRVRRFGPPLYFTTTSSCSWIDHSVSGLLHNTNIALFRLAFASAPLLQLNLALYNNSPVHSAKGTLSPFNGLELLVGIRFQFLFHSPPGVLFTFPSRYLFTIGH